MAKTAEDHEAAAEALEAFLTDISKDDPEAVRRLSDLSGLNVGVIPTGAISLDIALGVGGIPKGRIIELYGNQMSGKCVVADTLVWTDHGLETIAELFERCEQKASCTSRVTDISDLGVRLVNENGELEPVTHLTHNGRRPTRRVTLQSGRTVTATDNHPLRVLDGANIVWRNVGELQPGDVLVSATFGANESVGSGQHLSEDEAVMLGYLVSEGTLAESSANRFTFTNHHDADVVQEFCSIVESVLGVTAKQYGAGDYQFHSKQARQLLINEYGLEYGKAADKNIPYRVRTAGPKAQAAFLSALYEGDGWIEDGPSIGYTTASSQLAEQLQVMLYGLGIPASRSVKHNSEYNRDYYNVLIGSGATQRFLDQIGFRSERRAEQVAGHTEGDWGAHSNVENIPGLWGTVAALRDAVGGDRELNALIGGLRPLPEGSTPVSCTRNRLAKIIAWADSQPNLPPTADNLLRQLQHLQQSPYTFETITDVADAGEQPTFDVVVPGTHSFLANGVVSHNTSLALSVCSNAQKQGSNVAFIDVEHALSREHARDMGVDVERCAISQPGTGEEAFALLERMCTSGAFDLVVVDSVAALTPKAELEADYEDQQVGLLARLMSKGMRKLAGIINETGTTVIFINQLRTDVSVRYGNPNKPTGGRALAFYSSVRLEVRGEAKSYQIKDKETKQVIGQTCTVIVRKNKVGPPHREATYDLIFGEGIDSDSALFDLSCELGVIDQRSASYYDTTTGERIAVGRQNALDELKEDRSIVERLEQAVWDTVAPKDPTADEDDEDDDAGDSDEAA